MKEIASDAAQRGSQDLLAQVRHPVNLKSQAAKILFKIHLTDYLCRPSMAGYFSLPNDIL